MVMLHPMFMLKIFYHHCGYIGNQVVFFSNPSTYFNQILEAMEKSQKICSFTL